MAATLAARHNALAPCFRGRNRGQLKAFQAMLEVVTQSVRMSGETVRRIDRVAAALSNGALCARVSRAEAIRIIVDAGLRVLELQLRLVQPPRERRSRFAKWLVQCELVGCGEVHIGVVDTTHRFTSRVRRAFREQLGDLDVECVCDFLERTSRRSRGDPPADLRNSGRLFQYLHQFCSELARRIRRELHSDHGKPRRLGYQPNSRVTARRALQALAR